MALCNCDGPPHTYDPHWCVSGPKPPGSGPMTPTTPWGRHNLRAPYGSDRAKREDAIRRLNDGTPGAIAALLVLGVQPEEIDRG